MAFCAKCKLSAKSESRGGEKIKKQKKIFPLLSHASHSFLPSPHLAHKACYAGYTFTKLCTKQFTFKELTSYWALAPWKG